jgi:hypothetical protein
MPLPLLVVLISAGAAAPGWAGSADTAADTTEPDRVVECVLPTAGTVDTTTPPDTTEAVDTTEQADQLPSEAFFDGFCTRAQQVARFGPFLTGTPTLDGSEPFRAGMCDPGFDAPDEDQSERNWTIFILGTSQTDPEIGAAWLEAGVLTEFDEDDDDANEIDGDVLGNLVEIEMTFLDQLEANHDEWCADLLDPVDTTEARR